MNRISHDLYECRDCGGSGEVEVVRAQNFDGPYFAKAKVSCDACDGQGERKYGPEENDSEPDYWKDEIL